MRLLPMVIALAGSRLLGMGPGLVAADRGIAGRRVGSCPLNSPLQLLW